VKPVIIAIFFRSFLQIAVKYGGVDIPGSPFLMTSNPNIEDVVNAALAEVGHGSRKGSALSPERSYAKNGTGLVNDVSRVKK
jgi:hypothetical protein